MTGLGFRGGLCDPKEGKLRSGNPLERSGDLSLGLLADFGEPNPGEDFERLRTRGFTSPLGDEGEEATEQEKGVEGGFRSADESCEGEEGGKYVK